MFFKKKTEKHCDIKMSSDLIPDEYDKKVILFFFFFLNTQHQSNFFFTDVLLEVGKNFLSLYLDIIKHS